MSHSVMIIIEQKVASFSDQNVNIFFGGVDSRDWNKQKCIYKISVKILLGRVIH